MHLTELNPHSLLLSKRVKDITYDPFCLFQVNDYLPPDMYQALFETFPGEQWFSQRIEGDKRLLNSTHHPKVVGDFCRKHPLWEQLFQFLGSEAFLRDLYALVRLGLFRSRGLVSLRRWCHATSNGHTRAIMREPVAMQFEFSRLERGSFVPPHTDDPKKLVSLLLYFPDPKWQENYGGSTQFYRTKNPAMENNWDNRRVPFEDLVPFCRSQFIPNRLVVFLKSRNSYHGVQPIICPEGMARTSLNINIICQTPGELRHVGKFISRVGSKVKRLVFHS